MTTLAQISATFIAITAGFYTTKIITIIADKARIKGKIKEISIELNQVKKNYDVTQNEIDGIDYRNREKRKEAIKDYFMHRVEFEALSNIDDLASAFESYIEKKPDEEALEIFNEILPEITKASKEKEGERIERRKEKELTSTYPRDLIRSPQINLREIVHKPDHGDVVRTLELQSKHQYYDNLTDKRDSA